jgi:hypothetical protein
VRSDKVVNGFVAVDAGGIFDIRAVRILMALAEPRSRFFGQGSL